MPQLAYITRGNASPQGKPRVYFCCHPADQAAFLQPMAKDLLALVDCSVWYDPEPATPLSPEERSSREADLIQMQLFVLPVTTRLLNGPSRAMEWEFPLAREQRIPVLPILQEPGLETLFNQKCGDLQGLNPNQTDPTARPYAEKLKKFLESVLIGDELATQVRAAFDAYIFLSYRKKDRREAQALMRLIHESEFCRDIAIWYDEFLTPGEDFNHAIAQALEKSDLFALAVTPHLLENPNYVMREEFPAARQSGKPILPVEMTPVDRPMLEQAYPGIPPCASGQQGASLSEELKSALRGVALRENDSDPRHNFFIGLAYLSGIDVEVDKQRAMGLIQSAGDAGLPEAMEKLVAMYNTGDGVARDYRQAIVWRRRLADALRVRWEAAPTEDTFKALANALWELGDQYSDLADLAAACKLWQEEFLPLCRQAEAQGIACARQYLANGYSSLGNLYRRQGNLPAAKHWLKESNSLRLALSREDNTVPVRRDVAASQIQLGVLYQEEEDGSTLMYFEAAEVLARALVRDTGEYEDRQLLATACEWTSTEYKHGSDMKDLAKARSLLEESLQLRRALNDERPSSYTRRNLVGSSLGLGDLLRRMKDLPGARRCYGESLALMRDLVEETGGLDARGTLAVCLCRMGTLNRLEGDLPAAHSHYEEALALFRALADETGTLESRSNLAYCCSLLGALCKQEGDLPGSRHWLEESAHLRRAIVEESGLIQARRRLARDLYQLGTLPGGDTEALYQAVELWNGLADIKGRTSPDWHERHTAILTLAQHPIAPNPPAGLESAGRRLFEESLALPPALIANPGTPKDWWYLTAGHLKMGLISLAHGNCERAGYWFKNGCNIANGIVKKNGVPLERHALAVFLCHMGSLPGGDPQLLKQAAGIWASLAQECPQAPQYLEFRDIAATLLAKRTGEALE